MEPTEAQFNYAKDLMAKLGYDEYDFNIDTMTAAEISTLIDDLKKEWEG